MAGSPRALRTEDQSRAFYRLGLSMRLVEDLWPQTGRVAERAAASIVGDVRKVGGPEDLAELAQVTSNRLAFPPEDRKATAPALINDLRRRLDKFSLTRNGDEFFYAAGGFTYDMNLLGQELTRPDYVEATIEERRRKLLLLASSFATRCAAISDCKERALVLTFRGLQPPPEVPVAPRRRCGAAKTLRYHRRRPRHGQSLTEHERRPEAFRCAHRGIMPACEGG